MSCGSVCMRFFDGYSHMSCASVSIADGGYSNWSAWTACTKKYGGGTKDRARECNNPVPQNGGKTCDTLGSSKETVSCNTWNKQG